MQSAGLYQSQYAFFSSLSPDRNGNACTPCSEDSSMPPKPQDDRFRKQFRKTELCLFFEQSCCAKGAACNFAHGEGELQVRPDLKKTSLCPELRNGVCPRRRGHCPFAHSAAELRVTYAAQPEKPFASVAEAAPTRRYPSDPIAPPHTASSQRPQHAEPMPQVLSATLGRIDVQNREKDAIRTASKSSSAVALNRNEQERDYNVLLQNHIVYLQQVGSPQGGFPVVAHPVAHRVAADLSSAFARRDVQAIERILVQAMPDVYED